MSVDSIAGADAARAISGRLALLADGLDVAAAALPRATAGWSGPAAFAVSQLLGTRPERFRSAAVACRSAAGALARHAEAIAPAATLSRQAIFVSTEVSAALERRALLQADESARLTAGSLRALADSAPTRPEGWRGRLHQLNSVRAEVLLGTVESAEALASTGLKILSRVGNPFRRPSPDEFRRVGAAATEAARHPVGTTQQIVRAALDWDTWQANPARAVGHLVPDAVAAIASGGTAAGVRATTMAGQNRAALRLAVARDSLRREATGSVAAAARAALIQRAEAQALAQAGASSAGARSLAPAWHGEGGATLSSLQNAGVEAYHSMSTARERALTAIMKEVSQLGHGRLTGLDQRLKTLESTRRKVATELARTGGPLTALLTKAHDAVRYSVVLTETNYVRGVTDIAARLERNGFHPQNPHNAWHGPRYRGINSVWVDPSTGAAFEVQFHTPTSYRITKRTHLMYEEFRLPGTTAQRKAELHRFIAAEYRQAPIPGWVTALKADNFPPPTLIDPIRPPADYTAPAAGLGAGTAQMTEVEPRPPPFGGPASPLLHRVTP
jgi:hypothetical protein